MNIQTKPYNLTKPIEFSKKQKISYDSLSIYPILYNNSHLLIQTPILFIPFGVHYSKLDVSIDDDSFLACIKQIYCQITTKSYKIISSIKPKTVSYPERIRFSVTNEIIVFDHNKKKIKMDDITAQSRCKFLIHPAFLWKNKREKTCGIKWNILQIKLCSVPLPTHYSFIDSEDEDDCKVDNVFKKEPDPKYKKYFNMLSKGVPFFAVRQKLMIDGHDPNVIGEANDVKKRHSNPLPKLNFIKDIVKRDEPIEPQINRPIIKMPTQEQLKDALLNLKLNSQRKKNLNN